ncbi:MAG TPA: hypothetical protein VF713_02830 [Thermoanaerobaculia bacterium]
MRRAFPTGQAFPLRRQDLDAIACGNRRDQTSIKREKRGLVRLSYGHEVCVRDLLMAQEASKHVLCLHERRKEIKVSVMIVRG